MAATETGFRTEWLCRRLYGQGVKVDEGGLAEYNTVSTLVRRRSKNGKRCRGMPGMRQADRVL